MRMRTWSLIRFPPLRTSRKHFYLNGFVIVVVVVVLALYAPGQRPHVRQDMLDDLYQWLRQKPHSAQVAQRHMHHTESHEVEIAIAALVVAGEPAIVDGIAI